VGQRAHGSRVGDPHLRGGSGSARGSGSHDRILVARWDLKRYLHII
jgi:hypothetical protein